MLERGLWENFVERIAEGFSIIVTHEEVNGLQKFAARVQKFSSQNLERLTIESPTKRPHCRHLPHTCRQNAVRGFVRTFVAGYTVKYLVAVLPAILTGKFLKRPRVLYQSLGWDTLRFAVFLASWIGSFKALLCLLRRFRLKEDSWNPFIAGLLSSFCLLFDEKGRRVALALYLSSKAGQFFYVSLMRKKYLPRIPHGDSIVMGLASSQILYAFLLQPYSLAKPYHQFLLYHGGLLKHGNFQKGAQVMAAIAHSVYHPDTPIASYPIPVPATGHKFPGCQLEHPTTASCTMGGVRFILESFPRSMGLYGPLNLIMALAFRYHHLKNPQTFLFKILTSSLRSSTFLTAYCTTAWVVPCALRKLFQEEHSWYYMLNGFCSGLCVLLEAKGRRLELAMYCVPRALESLWSCWVKWGWVKNIPNGEAIYFSLAMATLMTLYQNERDTLSTGFRNVLERIFGEN